MKKVLKILILEDNYADKELAEKSLKKAFALSSFKAVDNKDNFIQALKEWQPNLIISDYMLPAFNGLEALKITREIAPLTPFIIFTGSMNEKTAVECMKAGADDYVIKEHLTRLAPASQNAIEKKKIEKTHKQTLNKLKESEEHHRSLVNNLQVGVFRSTVDGKFISANPAMAKIYGCENVEDLLNTPTKEFYTTEKTRKKILKEISLKGVLKNYETLERKKDGSLIWVSSNYKGVFDENGALQYLDGAILDITQQKEIRKNLKQSEKKYRHLVENMSEGIITVDTDENIQFANRAATEILGYSQKELINMNLKEFVPEKSFEKIRNQTQLRQKGKSSSYDLEVINKAGKRINISNNVSPIYKDNKVIGSFGVFTDTTEKKQMDTAINKLNACLLSLTSNHKENIRKITEAAGESLGGGCMLYNRLEKKRGLLCTWGIWNKPPDYNPEDKPEGHICYDVIKRQKNEPLILNNLSGTKYEKTDPNVKKYHLKSYLGYPIKINNKIVGSFCLCDIKQRKFSKLDIQILTMFAQAVANEEKRRKTQLTLKKSEAKYRTIFENTGTATTIVEEDTTISLANEKFTELSGYSKEEIEGKLSWTRFVVKEDLEKMKEYHRQRRIKGLSAPNRYEFRFKDREEKIHDILLTIDLIADTKKSVASLLDISKRKRDEKIKLLLYKLAKSVHDSQSLQKFYQQIHKHINISIDARNFYIALINEENNMIEFPYYQDEKDEKPTSIPRNESKGLSEYVIKTGKPLLAKKALYTKLAKEGKIELSGSLPEIWMGLPLKIKNKTKGVIAFQDYFDKNAFNKRDLAILDTISYQIAEFIEKKQIDYQNFRLSEIIRTATDGIILTDPSGKIKYINPAFERMGGYRLDEIKNTDPANLIYTSDKEAIAKEIRSAVKNKDEWQGELKCLRKNGEIYPINTRVFSIRNDKGELKEIAAIQQDITKQKEFEKSLRKSEKKYRAIFEATGTATMTVAEDKTIIDVNAECAQLSGYTKSQLIGKKWTEFVYKKDLPMMKKYHKKRRINPDKVPKKYEVSLIKANNQVANVILSIKLMPNSNISIVSMMDITKRKEIEEQYKKLFNSALVSILLYNDKGNLIATNPKATETLKLSLNELKNINKDFWIGKMFKSNHKPMHESEIPLMKVNKTHKPYEGKIIGLKMSEKDDLRWFLHSTRPILDQNNRIDKIVTAFVEITERKKLEEKLRFHSILLDQIKDLITATDLEGNIKYVNQAEANMFGKPKEELIGNSIFSYGEDTSPGATQKEILKQTLTEGSWRGEVVNYNKNGEAYILDCKTWKVTNQYGEDIALCSVSSDITERKQREERIKKDLREKEALLREIYHRTKNNMQVIASMIRMQSKLSRNEKIRKKFHEINNKISAMSLVHQKLYEAKDLSQINLKNYIKDLVRTLISSYKISTNRISLRLNLNDAPALIDTAVPLGLALNELFSNVFEHAFPDNKKGSLSVKLEKKSDNLIKIIIADNGIGIAPDSDINKISKVGISTVYMLIEDQLNGKVTYKNKNGLQWIIQYKDDLKDKRI